MWINPAEEAQIRQFLLEFPSEDDTINDEIGHQKMIWFIESDHNINIEQSGDEIHSVLLQDDEEMPHLPATG